MWEPLAVPVPESLNFDQVADRYDATRGGELRGEEFAPDIARLLRPDRAVLELGVGTGVIARALGALGMSVLGIDISEQMLARARERIGARVVRGDVMELPFATSSISQMVGVWVLHAVADVSTVMRETRRVLEIGGICLFVDGKYTFDESDPISVAYRDLEVGFGMSPRLGRAHDYARLAPGAGLDVVEIVASGPHRFETSIADAAENIRTKAHSWMWNTPDEEWGRVAGPVVQRLRNMPNFEASFWRDAYQEILVLRCSASGTSNS